MRPEAEIDADAAAERIWQTMKQLDHHHERLRQQMQAAARDPENARLVRERLVGLGLLDRVERLVAVKGLGV